MGPRLLQLHKQKLSIYTLACRSMSREDQQSLLDLFQARSEFSKQAVGKMHSLTQLEKFLAILVLLFQMESSLFMEKMFIFSEMGSGVPLVKCKFSMVWDDNSIQ